MTILESVIIPIVQNYTIQIFEKQNELIELLGTGILIKVKQRHFLLSAAHVLEIEKLKNIRIPLSLKEIGGLGKIKMLSASKDHVRSRDDDKIDLSIVELEKQIWSKLKATFKFLDVKDIELEHKIERDSLKYLVFGYPGIDTFHNELTSRIESKAFAYLTGVAKFEGYEKYGCDAINHIFLAYPKKLQKVTKANKHEKPPEPYGISGCGLWKLTETEKSKFEISLVGIMIEFQNRHGRVLIASRLNRLKLLLERGFAVNF